MKRILLFLACAAVFGSCIKDTGNYDYKDINQVTINVPTYTYVELEARTLRFDPQIEQTKVQDMSNLEFVWKRSTSGFAGAGASRDTLSTEPYIDIVIDPAATTIDYKQYYWLYVKDKLTDIVYPANAALIIRKPYDGAWMVLHDQGGAKLAGVEFYDDGTSGLTLDAFAREGAPALSGNPTGLGVSKNMGVSGLPQYYITYGSDNYNLPYIFTDDAASAGQYVQARKFGLARTIADMPQNKSSITNQKLGTFTMMHGNNLAVSMVLDGVFYQGRTGLRLYEAKIAAGLTSGGQPAPYFSLAHKVAWITMLYDSNGRRILAYNNNSNNATGLGMDAYKDSDNSAEVVDVNRPNLVKPEDTEEQKALLIINPIEEDREVIYLGTAGPSRYTNNERGTKPLAVAIGVDGNPKSYVYQFIDGYSMFTNTIAQLERLFTFTTPQTLTMNSVFASSVAFTNHIFYATGNTIYRLDYTTGKAIPVYVHPSGTIGKMKFARHDLNSYAYDSYGVPVNRSLGVLVETGANSSEFVVLNLTPSGFVSDDASVRPGTEVFTGFGRGVDIVFL